MKFSNSFLKAALRLSQTIVFVVVIKEKRQLTLISINILYHHEIIKIKFENIYQYKV